MKLKYKAISIILFILCLSSCGLDNYDEPSSELSGKVTYNGEAIGVKGTVESVQLHLFQDGYDLRTEIPVFVGQDGSFKALLFDGVYKMVARDRNGPWLNTRDTVLVVVKGSSTCQYPVTPYYMINNTMFDVDNDNKLTASFEVEKIAGNNTIESIFLLVSKTSFVDNVSQVARVNLEKPTTGLANISLDLNSLNERFLFARVGVKIDGVDEAIYSKIEKIK
ncbi:hypothetical protein AwDysgo_02870 [Bacteroidales bacterium]|nr:hypothetical protein AwDysgo_02870 [Bacteroidales bacterium]